MVGLEDAVRITEELIRRSARVGHPMDATVVLVGGSALAAHQVREFSEDVDLFAPSFSADVVVELEEEERRRYGPEFKLDVTSTENLWGPILVRDLISDARELVATSEIDGRTYALRALGLETLFLLKVAAGRRKDQRDLRLIAGHTSLDALVDRFNVLVAWHGDRQALAGFADAFVAAASELYGAGPEVIDRLQLPDYVRRMLWEARSET